jgi:hypothetical protein
MEKLMSSDVRKFTLIDWQQYIPTIAIIYPARTIIDLVNYLLSAYLMDDLLVAD